MDFEKIQATAFVFYAFRIRGLHGMNLFFVQYRENSSSKNKILHVIDGNTPKTILPKSLQNLNNTQLTIYLFKRILTETIETISLSGVYLNNNNDLCRINTYSRTITRGIKELSELPPYQKLQEEYPKLYEMILGIKTILHKIASALKEAEGTLPAPKVENLTECQDLMEAVTHFVTDADFILQRKTYIEFPLR
jgi:hypothetical protein